MPSPIPVPSETPPNPVNQTTFFDDINKSTARLDKLERGSLRSGSIGGAGLRFYDPEVGIGPNQATTTHVGEFNSTYWDLGTSTWVEADNVRGVAIYEGAQPNEDPWFVAGSVEGSRFFQVGSSEEIETAFIKARVISLDGSASLRLWSLPTVGAGSNVVIDSSSGAPVVKTISSALKYKQDVEDVVIHPEDVLLMQGRTWRDKNEVANNPETERRFVGFIADELADIPSLRQFVVFNENDEPDSIYYDRLTVGLVELAKHQQNKIESQQEQIDSLNERLNQLESMVDSIL